MSTAVKATEPHAPPVRTLRRGSLQLEAGPAASLPTRFGQFSCVAYRDPAQGVEHLAVFAGDLAGETAPMVRVHSECLTGEAFYSWRCDCRDQLDRALERIAEAGVGAVVYLRQEGRGIGLAEKVRAYALQEEGLDTVDANLALNRGADERTYDAAALVLADLGIERVRLLTNNPKKVEGLRLCGIDVVSRLTHVGAGTPHNANYLDVKAARMGHRYTDDT